VPSRSSDPATTHSPKPEEPASSTPTPIPAPAPCPTTLPDALKALLDLSKQLESLTAPPQDAEQVATQPLRTLDTTQNDESPEAERIAALAQRLATKAASLPPVPPTPIKPPPPPPPPAREPSPPPPVPGPSQASLAPGAKRVTSVESRLPGPKSLLSRSLGQSQGPSTSQPQRQTTAAAARVVSGSGVPDVAESLGRSQNLNGGARPPPPAGRPIENGHQRKVSQSASAKDGTGQQQRLPVKIDQRTRESVIQKPAAEDVVKHDDDEDVSVLKVMYLFRELTDIFVKDTAGFEPILPEALTNSTRAPSASKASVPAIIKAADLRSSDSASRLPLGEVPRNASKSQAFQEGVSIVDFTGMGGGDESTADLFGEDIFVLKWKFPISCAMLSLVIVKTWRNQMTLTTH
jgi:hypothetical protein